MREAKGPGANVATLEPQLVNERLTSLLSEFEGFHPAACCAGSAGAEVPEGRLRLKALLERLLPGCRVTVVHDTRLVLAAAGLQEGIALIAGTGSVAFGRSLNGPESTFGGWGWLIGDDGGGAWIAREGAREVMRRADTRRPPGALTDALLNASLAADVTQLSARLHVLREPREWAALAPSVFEAAQADVGAADIVRRAAAALCDLVTDVRTALGVDGPVVFAGGLLLNQPLLEAAVRYELGIPCLRLEEQPVAGAVQLAEESLSG